MGNLTSLLACSKPKLHTGKAVDLQARLQVSGHLSAATLIQISPTVTPMTPIALIATPDPELRDDREQLTKKNLQHLIVSPTHLSNKDTRTVKKSHWILLQMSQMSRLETCQFVLERVNKEI